MELTHVVPNEHKTFGMLTFAGPGGVEQTRVNGRQKVATRTYNLFSEIQRADNVAVILPDSAGEKKYDYETRVRLVNPRIIAVGKRAGNAAFSDYILYADDLVQV